MPRESQKTHLMDDGKADGWFSPLELHILSKLGRVPVAGIDQMSIRNPPPDVTHQALNRSQNCKQLANRPLFRHPNSRVFRLPFIVFERLVLSIRNRGHHCARILAVRLGSSDARILSE
jgi:hypothetical protein